MLQNKSFYLIAIMILILTSCGGEDFTPSSARLESSAQYTLSEKDVSSVDESLKFTVVTSVSDDYSFSLSSPSGLVWEGMLAGQDGVYTSDRLRISRTSSFEEGLYSYTLIASDGRTASGDVTYHRQHYTAEELATMDGESRDNYGNTVCVIQSGRPSDAALSD